MKRILLLIVGLFVFFTIYYFISLNQQEQKTVQDVLTETIAKRNENSTLSAQDIKTNTTNTIKTTTTTKTAAKKPNSNPKPNQTAPKPVVTPLVQPNENTINILLLGVDSRHNVTSTRCDAIHMLSLDVDKWELEITSIPRGTYTFIEGYPRSSQYMANACDFLGINVARQRIEKLLGIKSDYVVTVGFSQTYGILRQLKMPTTQSMQWLRNRKTFAIGDPQRSHNQALFMKDLLLRYIDILGNNITLPIEKVIFSYLNTDMDFDSARALLIGLKESKISSHPEKIRLAMKPYYKTKDYHFDFNDPLVSLKNVGIPGAGSSNPSDKIETLQTEQNKITTYIQSVLKKNLPLDDIMKKQLWRQIENEGTREKLHFEIVKRYADSLKTKDEKIEFISNYIVEKEVLGQDSWANKGKDLIEQLAN